MIVGGWKLRYKIKKPRKPQMKEYRKRDERLSELGYASYGEYLASDDWKKIRDAQLERFKRCLTCEKSSSQVHHLDYCFEVLTGLFPKLLVCLCRECHEAIEFDADRKRTLHEANAELNRRAHAAGMRRWLEMVGGARIELGIRRKKTRKKAKPPLCPCCRKNPRLSYVPICKACLKTKKIEKRERKLRIASQTRRSVP